MEQLWNTAVKAIADSGPIAIALVFAAVGVWAFATGRVRVGSLVEADKIAADARYAKMEEERDDWKAVAQTDGPELKRLNDLLGTAVQLLLDPARRSPPT